MGQLPFPKHVSGKSSVVETREDGTNRFDYRTAHNSVADGEYKRFIPETCQKCFHQAQEAEELGLEAPTVPDQELDYGQP